MVIGRKVAALAVSFVAGGLLSTKVKDVWNEECGVTRNVLAAVPTEHNRPNQIMQFGFPSNSNVKMRRNYVFGYDTRLRNASWVFEHLNKDLVDVKRGDRTDCLFVEDDTIHKFFRGMNQDYFRSGFDRGHLAAAANHRASQEWTADTFYLSNVVPQHPSMNREAWCNLEKYVRSLAYHNDNVYVCTGPLYLPRADRDGNLHVTYRVIGQNNVAVPTHLFKVVVCERKGEFELLSYVMPNDWVDPARPLKEFLHPIEAIERASGLIMFDRIPRHVFKKINRGRETKL